MITHLTGMSYWRAVASSWMFIWNEPSPVSSTEGISGTAIAAPIAAGRPKPIVPSPPLLIQRRGGPDPRPPGPASFDPAPRVREVEVLRPPHLVLADVGGQDALTAVRRLP